MFKRMIDQRQTYHLQGLTSAEVPSRAYSATRTVGAYTATSQHLHAQFSQAHK